jgi:signal transduction histidine kinase
VTVPIPILSVRLSGEHDVVAARQRARQLASLLRFDPQDQTRIATATSEIGRNALQYAGGGRVEFAIEGEALPQVLLIRISDQGPGIAALDDILAGRYRSATGMGLGIIGTKRLLDGFDIESHPGRGTVATLRKVVPRRAGLVTGAQVGRIVDALGREAAGDPVAEVQQQNQELLRALDELRKRQEQMARLNSELEDTNRGVVALYAELDERGEHLRRADELKSRFLSNMSHEFRTPLNSILALSRLLLDRVDGPLGEEQARQVQFISKAAEDLFELVNDLLDLARVEAGKIVIRPVEFTVDHLFGALRGMLRPLLVSPSLDLVFEVAPDMPVMVTDEAKVSQILRNFISNALKFTERGEIRVTAHLTPDAQAVRFAVRDTGVGIAPEDQEAIFQEFTQLDSRLQRQVKGTGLGLPLTRKLAELLGGSVTVDSAPGKGSTFAATIPVAYRPVGDVAVPTLSPPAAEWEGEPPRGLGSQGDGRRVLVIDNNDVARYLLRGLLRADGFIVSEAASGSEGLTRAREQRPDLIICDLLMPGMDGLEVVGALRADPLTRDIPVVMNTVKRLTAGEQADLEAAAAAVLSKEMLSRRDAVVHVRRALAKAGIEA